MEIKYKIYTEHGKAMLITRNQQLQKKKTLGIILQVRTLFTISSYITSKVQETSDDSSFGSGSFLTNKQAELVDTSSWMKGRVIYKISYMSVINEQVIL